MSRVKNMFVQNKLEFKIFGAKKGPWAFPVSGKEIWIFASSFKFNKHSWSCLNANLFSQVLHLRILNLVLSTSATFAVHHSLSQETDMKNELGLSKLV